MPVGLPPRGGPLGRSRGRLSASALTTYLRCPRQWLLGYQVGLQGPTRPSQVLGIVLEEAFCDVLMMHPPTVTNLEDCWRGPIFKQHRSQKLRWREEPQHGMRSFGNQTPRRGKKSPWPPSRRVSKVDWPCFSRKSKHVLRRKGALTLRSGGPAACRLSFQPPPSVPRLCFLFRIRSGTSNFGHGLHHLHLRGHRPAPP